MALLKPDDYEYTLQEVAEELGVCRETVRRIEAEALKKFKEGMIARGLGPSDLDIISNAENVHWLDS